MTLIAPSILAADFAQLGKALDTIGAMGASRVHIDVMDGHFTPEISVGQPVIASLRKATKLELDVHLMIERPERFIEDFAAAGADRLAIHAEATPDAYRAIKMVKNRGVKAGLALNVMTPIETGLQLLEDLDYLLILTSLTGSGEERFVSGVVNKVRIAAKERTRRGLDVSIEVEGGIGLREAEELILAGTDILVPGFAIFDKNSRNEMIRVLAGSMGSFANRGQKAKAEIH